MIDPTILTTYMKGVGGEAGFGTMCHSQENPRIKARKNFMGQVIIYPFLSLHLHCSFKGQGYEHNILFCVVASVLLKERKALLIELDVVS